MNIHKNFLKYGTVKNVKKRIVDIQSEREIAQKSWIVIMPESTFKQYWNILMIFLLLYVAIFVPF